MNRRKFIKTASALFGVGLMAPKLLVPSEHKQLGQKIIIGDDKAQFFLGNESNYIRWDGSALMLGNNVIKEGI